MSYPIRIRLTAISCFLSGKIPLRVMVLFVLPSSLRPKGEFVTTLFGRPFRVLADQVNGFLGTVDEIIISNQYRIEMIGDKDVVLDAGANMGIFASLVAAKRPGATVIAFEPTPSTFAALAENVRGYPNVTVVNNGLSDKEQDAFIKETGDCLSNHIDTSGTPVHLQKIDNLNTRVDFLKIDAEGYEANILEGASETIKKWKPIMVMSAYHKPNDKMELPALITKICPDYSFELRAGREDILICHPA
ncbi:MAG TPA: FkbM family methyltransferase [Candidatus Paceibacterota bacterium]|nr:FkbM family methyltransferase [Candidatus Paceibacterota bacterium]